MASSVIKRSRVASLDGREVAFKASPAGHRHAAPQVQVERDGERVIAIRVTCPCGQTMVLDCVYQDPGDAGTPAPPSTPSPEPQHEV